MKESISDVSELSNNEKNNLFVFYYSDSCGYCHMFEPEWENSVKRIKNSQLNVKPISIESQYFNSLNKKNIFNDISGVPTMALLDKNGTLLKKYDGERNHHEIMKWLHKHVGKKGNSSDLGGNALLRNLRSLTKKMKNKSNRGRSLRRSTRKQRRRKSHRRKDKHKKKIPKRKSRYYKKRR